MEASFENRDSDLKRGPCVRMTSSSIAKAAMSLEKAIVEKGIDPEFSIYEYAMMTADAFAGNMMPRSVS